MNGLLNQNGHYHDGKNWRNAQSDIVDHLYGIIHEEKPAKSKENLNLVPNYMKSIKCHDINK